MDSQTSFAQTYTTKATTLIDVVLEKHLPGVLDIFFDLDQERNGLPSIKQPVVVCEREVHHLHQTLAKVPESCDGGSLLV